MLNIFVLINFKKISFVCSQFQGVCWVDLYFVKEVTSNLIKAEYDNDDNLMKVI